MKILFSTLYFQPSIKPVRSYSRIVFGIHRWHLPDFVHYKVKEDFDNNMEMLSVYKISSCITGRAFYLWTK